MHYKMYYTSKCIDYRVHGITGYVITDEKQQQCIKLYTTPGNIFNKENGARAQECKVLPAVHDNTSNKTGATAKRH